MQHKAIHYFRWLFIMVMLSISSCSANSEVQRYRGSYTWGHEVNSFCPQINSQCYWLSPITSQVIRERLKQLSIARQSKPYESICVVISGTTDRSSPRQGFATDYDGLIHITDVYGTCESSTVVTEGDLRHNRWVLQKVNNKAVNREQWRQPLALDFREDLFVEVSDGCRVFSGKAELVKNELVFTDLELANDYCDGSQENIPLFSIAGAWQVNLPDSTHLMLRNQTTSLSFELDDWRI